MLRFDQKNLKDLSPEIFRQVQSRIHSGERISALIQAGLICFLIFIWFFSPRAVDSQQQFEAIPTILLFYGPLLLLRLYWAFNDRIPETTSILFTIIDIAAITTLIFLYHIQYGTAPSLSLKSPTFLFLLLVVVTRSLCFRPSLVLVATLVASGLWALLTYYSVHHPMAETTRSFVEYSSTAKVLIGAEVEKILALLAIGGTLAFGVRSSMGVLLDAVTAAEQERSLSLFFSPEISEKIRSGKIEFQPGKGESYYAAVLFIDLRGFTDMAQRQDPNTVLKLLTEYQGRVAPIVMENNGTIDKYMGDGILVHFGAASPTSTYAKDVLLAIDSILNSFDAWNLQRKDQGDEPVDVNLAAAVGPVVFGATGTEKRLEMTIIGQTVNLAAKLEKFNKALNSRAIVTTKILSQARDQGLVDLPRDFQLATKQSVPGVSGAIDLNYIASDSEKASFEKAS